jgi:hypothetical protein
MTEVTSLGARRAVEAGDNRLWTPVECLHDVIREIENGTVSANGVLVLHLTKTDTTFDVGYSSSNIKSSEMLAMLEIAKQVILEEMGYA